MPSRFLTATVAAVCFVVCNIGHGAEGAKNVPEDELATSTALDAVKRRIDAFNKHDLDSYLNAHHENVRIYEYPEELIGEGRSHLRRIFGPLLEEGIGSIDVVYQAVVDRTVVSEEILNYGEAPIHIVVVYTVENNVISGLRLIEPAD